MCGVLGVGCLSETRYVCPPGSDVTASVRCGAACASGELSAADCVLVEAACADGRLSAVDCEGLGGDMGVDDLGVEDQGDTGPDGDVIAEVGVDGGPCDGLCGGGEPHCNMTSGECVECLDSSHCAGQQCSPEGVCVECLDASHCTDPLRPFCLASNCVACEDAADCDATNPVCETPAQTCGDCTNRGHCLRYSDLPSCNVTTGQCVECDIPNQSADCADTALTPACSATGQCVQCNNNSFCTAATASRCEGNSCAPCMNNTDCGHIAGRNRCDGGRCVGCTVATENVDCGLKSCNPVTRMCSTIDQNSRDVCEPCVADSDCTQVMGTFRCIAMNYMGVARPGGYCMRAAPGCTRPFGMLISRASLSGVAATNYCGVDETVTSCEAVNALRTGTGCPSGNASECMADGSVCATVGGFMNQCTYPCSAPTECLQSGPGSSCGGSHCGS